MPPVAEAMDPKRSRSRRTSSTSIEEIRRTQEPERATYQRARYRFSLAEQETEPTQELVVSRGPVREARHWTEAGTSTVRFAQVMSRLLQRFYSLREPVEVTDFLSNNSFLFPILIQAHTRAKKRFSSSKLFLGVVTDPELEDTRMMISISTDLAPDKTLLKLEQLDEEWWLAASGRAKGKLTITVEFR